ncbi:MAG TPA: HD domain-containing phosphohydrolase [Acidimicrobiales bacterium]|nr:HD domain-containing phosphohydrolase [Acidimicrobiales bacterium]
MFRRLIPLAALLKMTMLFPDHAPSRMAVAIRAGSTRDLERRFRDGPSAGLHEPASAASEILALAAAINNHDRATRGHSERVRVLSEMIAEELGLSTADRDRLRWSSLLHDVGKLSVHRDILNKSSAPTEQEWEALRQHPLEGARLTAPLKEWLGEWSLAIEQHHERFDGSGYPFGHAGTEISLGARIVAVADSFEVMTSARSYKDAVSPSAARAELAKCAGNQFDPAIVRAFLGISIGRLRWTIGPASWLAEAPLAQWATNAGRFVVASSHVAVATSALVASAIVASPIVQRVLAPAARPAGSSTPVAQSAQALTIRTRELVATLRSVASKDVHQRVPGESSLHLGPVESNRTLQMSSHPAVAVTGSSNTSSESIPTPVVTPVLSSGSSTIGVRTSAMVAPAATESGAGIPGKSGSAPGNSGTAPGNSGTAPGASGSAPGNSGTAPGASGSAPGNSGTAPGASGSAPGNSGTAPGASGSASNAPESGPSANPSSPTATETTSPSPTTPLPAATNGGNPSSNGNGNPGAK